MFSPQTVIVISVITVLSYHRKMNQLITLIGRHHNVIYRTLYQCLDINLNSQFKILKRKKFKLYLLRITMA